MPEPEEKETIIGEVEDPYAKTRSEALVEVGREGGREGGEEGAVGDMKRHVNKKDVERREGGREGRKEGRNIRSSFHAATFH